jgi:hypothetical protein
MRVLGINLTEWIGGAICVGVGLIALTEALSYPLGTLLRMGPGFYPAILAAAMVVLGLGIIVVEGRGPHALPIGEAHLRGLIAVVPAIAVFALLIDRFGMIPAVAASVLVSSRAEPELGLVRSLALAGGLAMATTALFVFALGLPVAPIGW